MVQRRDISAILRDFEGRNPGAYWRRFAILLAIAAIVATIGLYNDSGPVVIAAMLIAPLMTPILGVGASMLRGRLVRSISLLMAIAIAMAGVILIGYLVLWLLEAPRGVAIASEVMKRTAPNIGDLIVALAAGTAGAIVQVKREEVSLLPGVAIGVSLVPPLSAAGILIYFHEPEAAWNAILLYLTNLAAIVLSAAIVFWFFGMRPRRKRSGEVVGFSIQFIPALAAAVLIGWYLTNVTLREFDQLRAQEGVVAAVTDWKQNYPVEITRIDVADNSAGRIVEVGLVFDLPFAAGDSSTKLSDVWPSDLNEYNLRERLLEFVDEATEVRIRMQLRLSGVINLETGELNSNLPAPIGD